MKKIISLALCIVMLFSVVSVCSVAADSSTWNALSVKATDVVGGKVTYNVYLEPNVSVVGAIVRVKYDDSVLEPILPETFEFEDKTTGQKYTLPAFADGGAFMVTDKYGDLVNSVPNGIYVGGKVYDEDNVVSVAYTGITAYQNTARKGFFSIPFKVIDSSRPITSVEFYCTDFKQSDEEQNVSSKPVKFATVKTDTFETAEITGVTPAATGMQITWKATAGADSYIVYRKNDKGSWEKIGTVATTSFIDTEARSGVTESYAVKALNDGRFKSYDQISGLYLAPVAKVTAANSGAGVKISWSAVKGASGYRVYKRVTNADGTKTAWMTMVSSTANTSYTDANVANDVKYEYIVRAYKGKVFSANSSAAGLYHYDAPTVKLASAKGGVKITWNEIEGAESYKVYRRNNGTSTWTCIKTVKAGTLSFVDSAATSGKKLDYTVKAISSKGNSNYIAKTINYIATPKLASLTNGTSGVVLKWGAVTGATKYRVYRKVAGASSWTALADVKTTSYTDKTAKSGTKYVYTVKAFNGSLTSGYDATGLTLKYLAMPKLTKISNPTGGITVTWNAVTGASSGYRVYRKAAGSSSWTNLGTVKTTSFTDKTATKGKTYTYTVRAVDGSNLSAYNTTGLSIKRAK